MRLSLMSGIVRAALVGLPLMVAACGGTEEGLTGYTSGGLAMTAVSSSSGVTVVGSVPNRWPVVV